MILVVQTTFIFRDIKPFVPFRLFARMLGSYHQYFDSCPLRLHVFHSFHIFVSVVNCCRIGLFDSFQFAKSTHLNQQKKRIKNYGWLNLPNMRIILFLTIYKTIFKTYKIIKQILLLRNDLKNILCTSKNKSSAILSVILLPKKC